MFLDLRFLLEILLRWMGRPVTDSAHARRRPAAVAGRIAFPDEGSPLSLTPLNRDHETLNLDLSRHEPLLVNALAGLPAPTPAAPAPPPAPTYAPSIGTFTVNPTSVQVGTSVTLSAANVTETGGTIAGVQFCRESNGIAGLQAGSDTLVGSASQSGNNT